MAIDKLEQYANDLKVVDDGEYGQFEYIIDMGKQTKSLDQKLCTKDNQMYGCQAQVWIVCQKKESNIITSVIRMLLLLKA